jgi:hypothetical protein
MWGDLVLGAVVFGAGSSTRFLRTWAREDLLAQEFFYERDLFERGEVHRDDICRYENANAQYKLSVKYFRGL